MTLVDTSSLIHFLRKNGDPVVSQRVRLLIQKDQAALCPMVIAELWMGASSKSDKEDIEDLVSLLHHFPIQEEVWKTANRLAAICRSKGTPVPGSDLVIAACAFFRQAEIESSDRHFDILEKYRPLL